MEIKTKVTPTLGNGAIYTYGFSGMFLNTFYLMFMSYFRMIFLTNVLQLDTLLAATVNSVTVWLNVLTMIFGGIIVDSTSLKWGKYRSWILFGSWVVLICYPLMFTNFGVSQTISAIIFCVLFFVQSLGYNTMWTAQRSIVGPMSKNSADAVALSSTAQQGSTLGGIVYGLVGAAILGIWGTSSNAYGLTALIYAAFIAVGAIIMFNMTKKYDQPVAQVADKSAQKAQKIGFFAMFKNLKGPMIPFFFSMTLGNCQMGFFFTLLAFFTGFVLNDPATLGLSVTLGSIAGLLGAWLSKKMCEFMGKKKTYIIFTAITAICYMLIAIIGKTSVPFLVLRACIGCFSIVGGMLLPAFANDLADYNVMKGNKDARAFVQSIAGTTIRLGSAIATMVASFGLALVGYSAGAEVTSTVINGITWMMAFGPGIVCLLSCLLFAFYKVNEKDLDEFRNRASNQKTV